MLTAAMPFCRLRPAEPMNAPSPFSRGKILAAILVGAAILTLAGTAARAENLALQLDGNASYVELPPNLGNDLSQATIEVWANWAELRRYARVFEFGRAWNSIALIEHDLTTDVRFNLYAVDTRDRKELQHTIRGKDVIRTNQWIHFAAVSGAGGMSFYVNGLLVGQHTNTASFATIGGGTNVLGHSLTGRTTDQDFCGQIDELRIWNYCRTADQVRADMYKRLVGDESGLVHLWNFDDGTTRDAGPRGAHGILRGNANVGATTLQLVEKPAPMPPPIVASIPAITPPTPPVAMIPAPTVQTDRTNLAVWWIAGALTALALVLAWLALMFRRSGLGKEKIVVAQPQIAAAAPIAVPALPPSPAPSIDHAELKQQALEELTEFAKESLVQGLFTQRAALLEANRKAQAELTTLEERLASLSIGERIRAYEERIENLEQQLATRGSEVKELTSATLKLLRAKLEEERRKATPPSRFN
jgi:hypothetical protein